MTAPLLSIDTDIDTTDATDPSPALPGTSAVFLAACADAFKPVSEISEDDIYTYGSGKHKVTAAFAMNATGLAMLGGVSDDRPLFSDKERDALLAGVRAVYKTLDPKVQTMGAKPSGGAAVKEIIAALLGDAAQHSCALVSRVRRNVWQLVPSGTGEASDRVVVESVREGTATVYVPHVMLDQAIDCNAFLRACRFLTATDSFSAKVQGVGKVCLVPTKVRKDGSVSYALRKMITPAQALSILAKVGWRTPGSDKAGQIVLPVLDTSTKKSFVETHGLETWDRLATAKATAMTALRQHRRDAIETIMGARPLSVKAIAARAVQTGSHYRQVLLAIDPTLVDACETMGALTGFVDALKADGDADGE